MDGLLQGLLWNLLVTAGLAVGAWGVSRLPWVARRPSVVYGMWLLVLAKLVCPPLIGVPVLRALPVEEQAVVGEEVASGLTESIAVESDWVVTTLEEDPAAVTIPYEEVPVEAGWEPWMWWWVAAGMSVVGTVLLWGSAWRQTLQWGRLLKECGLGPERVQLLAERAAKQMGMRYRPVVRVVRGRLTPFLWVKRRGVEIVLSEEVVTQLTAEELVCVLSHELAHYRRRDHWGHWFAGWVVSVFWWNPIGWWGWREMRAAQEVCCDALVLARNGEGRKLYAETLFKVLELVQTGRRLQPSLACGFGDGAHLRRRFEMLADLKLRSGSGVWWKFVVVPCVGLLFCLPIRGEGEKAKEEVREAVEVPGGKGMENGKRIEGIDLNKRMDEWMMREYSISLEHYSKDPGKEVIKVNRPRVTVFEGREGLFEIDKSSRTGDGKGNWTETEAWFSVIPQMRSDGKITCDVALVIWNDGEPKNRRQILEQKVVVEPGKPLQIDLYRKGEAARWVVLNIDSQSNKSAPLKFANDTVTPEMKMKRAQEYYVRVFNKASEWSPRTTMAKFKMTLYESQWGACAIPLDENREMVIHLIPRPGKRGPEGFWFGTEYRSGKERNQPLDKEGLELPLVLSGVPYQFRERPRKGHAEEVSVSIGGEWVWEDGHEREETVKTYGISDLILKPGEDWEIKTKELVELLKREEPKSWNENGAKGNIEINHTTLSLVVRQTGDVHKKIEERLQEMKKDREKLQGFRAHVIGAKDSTKLLYQLEVAVEEEKKGEASQRKVTPTKIELSENQTVVFENTRNPSQDSIQLKPEGVQDDGVQVSRWYNSPHISALGISALKQTWEFGKAERFELEDKNGKRSGAVLTVTFQRVGGEKTGPAAGKVAVSRAEAQKVAEPKMTVQIYGVEEILLREDRDYEREPLGNKDIEALYNVVRTIEPKSWKGNGGFGSVKFDPETLCLVVQQTEEVHKKVTDKLVLMQIEAKELRGVSVDVSGKTDTSKPRYRFDMMISEMKSVEGAREKTAQRSVLVAENQTIIFDRLFADPKAHSVVLKVEESQKEGVRVSFRNRGAQGAVVPLDLEFGKAKVLEIPNQEGKPSGRMMTVTCQRVEARKAASSDLKGGAKTSKKGTIVMGAEPTPWNLFLGVVGTTAVGLGVGDVGDPKDDGNGKRVTTLTPTTTPTKPYVMAGVILKDKAAVKKKASAEAAPHGEDNRKVVPVSATQVEERDEIKVLLQEMQVTFCQVNTQDKSKVFKTVSEYVPLNPGEKIPCLFPDSQDPKFWIKTAKLSPTSASLLVSIRFAGGLSFDEPVVLEPDKTAKVILGRDLEQKPSMWFEISRRPTGAKSSEVKLKEKQRATKSKEVKNTVGTESILWDLFLEGMQGGITVKNNVIKIGESTIEIAAPEFGPATKKKD